MTPRDDLATLRDAIERADDALHSIQHYSEPFDVSPFRKGLYDAREAIKRVEAELARLGAENEVWERVVNAELTPRMEAAEAKVAALTQERDEALDIPGAEAGWDGATTEWQRRAEAAEVALADTRQALEEAKWLIGAGLPHTMEWHDRADAWYTEARRALAATDTGQEPA